MISEKKVQNPLWLTTRTESEPAACFRVEFDAPSTAKSAVLQLSALGVCRAFLNGEPVGDARLTPGYTDSRKRNYWFEFDIAPLLRPGKNVLAVEVADGWHCGHVGMFGREVYGSRRGLWCRLVSDGNEVVGANTEGWRVGEGGCRYADLLMGETWDARMEPEGWKLPGFDSRGWDLPATMRTPALLEKAEHPPIRVIRLEDARLIQQTGDVRLYDVGQNLAGVASIEVIGKSGDTLTLRHGEMLSPDGTLYTANLRAAKATDHYTIGKTGEVERFEPAFTFHGFRYVEVSGPGEVLRVQVHACSSDITFHGQFQCSDSRLNQLASNIEWSMRSNFLDVPTDCPQRDERLGWTGDAEVFMPTAAYLADIKSFFRKWLLDFTDAQRTDGAIPMVVPAAPLYESGTKIVQEGGPAWADAFTICAAHHWDYFADADLIHEIWPSLARFVEFLHQTSKDGERCWDGYTGFRGFGDWLAPGPQTDLTLIGTAYYAASCGLAARLAKAVGKDDEAYRHWSDDAQKAFVRLFAAEKEHTQTGWILGLWFRLFPESDRPAMASALAASVRKNGLLTGFIGTAHLCTTLSQYGFDAEAYQVLFHEKWPGWLFPISEGATTMWERWDGWDPVKGFEDVGMNSFNHYAFGAIGEWMFGYLAGIRWDASEPGRKKAILDCRPDPRLQWVSAGSNGVSSSWRYLPDKWTWTISSDVPFHLIPPQGMALSGPSGAVSPAGQDFPAGRFEFSAPVT